MAEYSGTLASVTASQRTARLFREAAELTRDQILRDGATILDLIDAEQSVATADIALASTVRDLARSYILLNVSLGSGNSTGDDLPPPNAE